jgi:FixJ family two-component response regulator
MNQNKIKFAFVDDDESFASALERRFRLLGLEVTTYPSAEAFLASTTLPRPDCLVLDIQLSGMSGLDLQRRLQEVGDATPMSLSPRMTPRRFASRLGVPPQTRAPRGNHRSHQPGHR